MADMKKRILVVNTVFTGFNGVTSIMMNYFRKTRESVDYDFVLCGRNEEKFVSELKNFGCDVFIPPCSRVKKPLKYAGWLKKILLAKEYHAIHVHGNSGTMYIEMRAAKAAGVAVRVAHSHSTFCKFKLAHKLMKPLLNRELTHAVACSDMAGKWLFTVPFTVLINGIDTSRFAYSEDTRAKYRRELGLDGCFVIGHVGYMDTEKNHFFLLRAFKEIVRRDASARLLLVGDGRLRSEIEAYVSENGLSDHVMLLGKRADVAALYQAMDVFVLPSVFEGLPVTLVEAQAAGLPCFVSANVTREVNLTGGMRYISVDDENITEWADELLDAKTLSVDRTEFYPTISDSVFNINNCVATLLGIYQINKSDVPNTNESNTNTEAVL